MLALARNGESKRNNVCVIGSGVIGLSCAYAILRENLDIEVSVISASLRDEDTTSWGSAGLWKPNLVEGNQELIEIWGSETFEYFMEVLYSDDAAEAGVSLMSAHHLFESEQPEPFWKDTVLHFKHLDGADLKRLGVPSKYAHGYTYETVTVQQSLYLPFLKSKLTTRGVTFIERRINNLEDFLAQEANGKYTAVINCAGLGSHSLAQDTSMFPIRGQVVRVKAPWIKSIWFFGTSYIIPNIDNVVLGGTAEVGEWETTPSAVTTEKIIADVASLFPSIRSAPIEHVWVGLRPGRPSVRVENEGSVIHCYGHGGCGVTLSMGCAREVVKTHLAQIIAKT